MKYLLLLLISLCYFQTGYSQSKIKKLDIKKVSLQVKGRKPIIKGFLIDLSVDSATILLGKKINDEKINFDCAKPYCQKLALQELSSFRVYKNSKANKIFGTSTGIAAVIAGVLVATADPNSNSNPDGLQKRYGYFILSSMISVGSLFLWTASKKPIKVIKEGKLNQASLLRAKAYSLKHQIGVIQMENQHSLRQIIEEIKTNPLTHLDFFRIIKEDKTILEGYLVGKRGEALVFCKKEENILPFRKQLPKSLIEIPLTEILYFSIIEGLRDL